MSVPDPRTEWRVSFGRFILMAGLLDRAFGDANPTPDHLAHECELAERALTGLTAREGWTGDLVLARLFDLSYRDNPDLPD